MFFLFVCHFNFVAQDYPEFTDQKKTGIFFKKCVRFSMQKLMTKLHEFNILNYMSLIFYPIYIYIYI